MHNMSQSTHVIDEKSRNVLKNTQVRPANARWHGIYNNTKTMVDLFVHFMNYVCFQLYNCLFCFYLRVFLVFLVLLVAVANRSVNKNEWAMLLNTVFQDMHTCMKIIWAKLFKAWLGWPKISKNLFFSFVIFWVFCLLIVFFLSFELE